MRNTATSIAVLCSFAWTCFLPGAYAQQLQVKELMAAPVGPQLKTSGIGAVRTPWDDNKNYEVGLYGEIVPKQIHTLVNPQYNIDWNKETVVPVIYFGAVPLRDPKLLTDKNDGLVILSSDIGNHGPMGKQLAGVFSDDDVLTLRKALNEAYGPGKLVREGSYVGNVYVWKKNGITARLTIEHEALDGSASEERNGVKQNGRHGTLTIYNKVVPGFYSEHENYFNDPDLRKNPTLKK